MLWELSLDMNTVYVEKMSVLSLLTTESWLGSKEGSGGQYMSPELLNKAFSAKATRQNPITITSHLGRINEVCSC